MKCNGVANCDDWSDENEELELSPTDNDASIEPFAKVGIISKGRIAAIKTIVQNE